MQFTKSVLLFFVLVSLALPSGCGQSITTDSPTLTPMPSQTPTAIATSNPTSIPNTPHPEGTLIFYNGSVNALDLQTKTTEAIFNTQEPQYNPTLLNGSYYFLEDPTGDAKYQVFRANLANPNVEQLTFDDNDIYYYAISPKETYIAYTVHSNSAIVLFDIKSNVSRVIAQTDDYDYTFSMLSWSPDGNNLVYFKSYYKSNGGQLFLYSLEDQITTELLKERRIDFRMSEWSPNGKKLILTIGNPNSYLSSIYVFDIDNNALDLVEQDAMAYAAEWSPDGNMILYLTDQLELADLNNHSIQTIAEPTKDQTIMQNILWSPDGRYIGYITCLWHIVATGKPPQPSSCLFNMQDVITDTHWEIGIPATYSVFWIYP